MGFHSSPTRHPIKSLSPTNSNSAHYSPHPPPPVPLNPHPSPKPHKRHTDRIQNDMSCVSFRTTHQKDSTRIGLGQITLRMPVPLGRSFSDPSFLSSQIVVCVVLFHLILGVIAYGIAGASLLWRGDASSSDHHHPTVLILSTLTHHMKLSAIFAPTPLPPVVSEASIGGAPTPPSASTTSMDSITVGDDVRFLLLHIASAISFAVPFSRIVQRRKFVLDFVVTVYVLYSVAGSVVVGNW